MGINCPRCSNLFRRIPMEKRFYTTLNDGFNENSTDTYRCPHCKRWFERYNCYGYEGRWEERPEKDLMKANKYRRGDRSLIFEEYPARR